MGNVIVGSAARCQCPNLSLVSLYMCAIPLVTRSRDGRSNNGEKDVLVFLLKTSRAIRIVDVKLKTSVSEISSVPICPDDGS
jgi:hypothetical protein